jgi:hypothetical protein
MSINSTIAKCKSFYVVTCRNGHIGKVEAKKIRENSTLGRKNNDKQEW